LRILGTIDDGETADAPFETIAQLPPIPSSDACKIELDLRIVRAESFLDFVRDRVQRKQLDVPVQVSSQHAR